MIDKIGQALTDAFMITDKYLFDDPRAWTTGSTAVVAALSFLSSDPRIVVVANTGDSRAVIMTATKADPVSTDHKATLERERKRIIQQGGQILSAEDGIRVYPSGLAITRALGDVKYKNIIEGKPEIMAGELSNDDEILLLATDGFWDVFKNEQAFDWVSTWMKSNKESSMDILAHALVEEAINRGSEDNVTVIAVELNSIKPAQPFMEEIV
ncbi:unnamed protein product [Didymodactylos carnosus]|uniref:PPM-type phosphatase domain-containing protein n=1 Tax=Didymodactylos carnosus TaxID=1234261 RepID=A0A8S2EMH1_9BILA|nr:unnamed protein product [Didymodactylos carnosus]CAF3997048.1 unnamed protein product [Didymodactylos carnosus]